MHVVCVGEDVFQIEARNVTAILPTDRNVDARTRQRTQKRQFTHQLLHVSTGSIRSGEEVGVGDQRAFFDVLDEILDFASFDELRNDQTILRSLPNHFAVVIRHQHIVCDVCIE